MSSIDNVEWIKLKAWAVSEADYNAFSDEKSEKTEDFWIERKQEDSYIMEYDFETLPKFETLCMKLLKQKYGLDKNLQRIVSIAAFKNMPQEESDYKTSEGLPEYRYSF